MIVIQLESVENLNKNDVSDILIDESSLVDIYEDGCVVGYGYTHATELVGEEFQAEFDSLCQVVVDLGGRFNKNTGEIYFTDEFCENYAKDYFLALKDKFANLTLKEFCSTKTRKELEDLKKLLPLYSVEIYSDTLNAAITDFLECVQHRFYNFNKQAETTVKEIPYKVVSIFLAY